MEPPSHEQAEARAPCPVTHGVKFFPSEWSGVGWRKGAQDLSAVLAQNRVYATECWSWEGHEKCWKPAYFNCSLCWELKRKEALCFQLYLSGVDLSSFWAGAGRSRSWFKCHRLSLLLLRVCRFSYMLLHMLNPIRTISKDFKQFFKNNFYQLFCWVEGLWSPHTANLEVDSPG